MCTTTGTGRSKKRAFSVVRPDERSTSRAAPAAAGTKVSASRLAGIHHSRRARGGAPGRVAREAVVVMPTSLVAPDVRRIGPQAGAGQPIGRSARGVARVDD